MMWVEGLWTGGRNVSQHNNRTSKHGNNSNNPIAAPASITFHANERLDGLNQLTSMAGYELFELERNLSMRTFLKVQVLNRSICIYGMAGNKLKTNWRSTNRGEINIVIDAIL